MTRDEVRAVVKELAAAVSTQSQVANRTWLAAMAVVFVGVLPRVDPNKEVKLPFELGSVDPDWFHAIVFAMLVVLVIAFCAANAQLVRAQKLAYEKIDALAKMWIPQD